MQRPAAPRALAEALFDAAADAASGTCVQLFQALCQALGTLVAEVAPQPGVLLPRHAARHGNRRSERGVVTLFEWRQNKPGETRKSQRGDAEVDDAVAPAAKRQCGAGVLRRDDVGKSLPGCARFRIGERIVPALVFVMQRASPVLAELAVACGDAADDASVGAEVPLPLLAGLSADEQHAAFLVAVEFAYTGDVAGCVSDNNLSRLQPLWLLAHALRMDALCAWVMPQLVCAAARPPPSTEANNEIFSLAPLLQLLELSSSHPCSELATAAARALLARLAELNTLLGMRQPSAGCATAAHCRAQTAAQRARVTRINSSVPARREMHSRGTVVAASDHSGGAPARRSKRAACVVSASRRRDGGRTRFPAA